MSRIPKCLFYLLAFLPLFIFAQAVPAEKDLWNEYSLSKDSTQSVDILVKLSKLYFEKDRSLSEQVALRAVALAKSCASERTEAKALTQLSNVYFDEGKYLESFYLAKDLFRISKELDDLGIYAQACIVIGRHYHFRGDNSLALDFFLKGLKYYESVHDTVQVGEVCNAIGGVYLGQSNYKSAYENYHRSLLVQFQKNNTKGIARGYLNMANAIIAERDFDQGKRMLDSALFYYKQVNSDEGRGYVYATVADIFIEHQQIDSALAYLMKSRQCLEEVKKYYTLVQVDQSIAELYFKRKDWKNTLRYIDEGINAGLKINRNNNLASLNLLKSQVFEQQDRKAEALESYKLYKVFSDSVLNNIAIKKQTEDAFKYDQEREEQKSLLAQKERDSKQRLFLRSSIMGLIVLAAVLLLVIGGYRSNQKINKIIAIQKEEVEKQHRLLKEKNQEVLDSIGYAKRLQNAILPSQKNINSYLANCFVLFKPKDIVAGDFYWIDQLQTRDETGIEHPNGIIVAAADCTGHGVPGALVSVVCSNALNRSIKEFNLSDPGKILDKVRELVLETFEKSESAVNDGMDISLGILDTSTNTLKWSGANNPLWIIRDHSVIQLVPDKQPVGKFELHKPFTTHTIPLKSNDSIYLFTDGFADQFGGPKGKKFKNNSLKELLLKSSSFPFKDQHDLLLAAFEDWKGHLDQVDDVTIIAIKI